MQGWRDGLNLLDVELNPECQREPKKASRDTDYSIQVKWRERFLERRLLMQQKKSKLEIQERESTVML